MKTVTLINPPWYFPHPRDVIIPQDLGIGYLAAYLRRYGYRVRLIHAVAEGAARIRKVRGRYNTFYEVGLAYRDIAGRIPPETDFIGISAPFTNNAPIVKALAAEIKDTFPRTPIILGGAYPSLAGGGALCRDIDYCVIGEGETALLDLVSGKEPGAIPGVLSCGKENGDLSSADIIENLDDIPFPARDRSAMEQSRGYSPRKERRRSASVITSRGCPYECAFCSIHRITGRLWRKRSAGNVLAEIRELAEKSGIEHVEFEDDNLTLDRGRSMEIFEGIKKINCDVRKISWSTPNGVRIDTLDREVLRAMKRSGCLSLSFGIESGDPCLLRAMNKHLDTQKILEIIALCGETGIKSVIFLMIGYPGETDASFGKTIEFVRALKKHGADIFYAGIVRAYPGTKLFDECRRNNYLPADDRREDIFLGNLITPGNAITTPDFNPAKLRRRLATLERLTVPWYLRVYHRHYPVIRRLIPGAVVRKIKTVCGAR